MPSNRKDIEDRGEDQPTLPTQTPSSKKKKKRTIRRKLTGTSAATEVASNTTATVKTGGAMVDGDSVGEKQTTTKTAKAIGGIVDGDGVGEKQALKKLAKVPFRKPERSSSTDDPLLLPNRNNMKSPAQQQDKDRQDAVFAGDPSGNPFVAPGDLQTSLRLAQEEHVAHQAAKTAKRVRQNNGSAGPQSHPEASPLPPPVRQSALPQIEPGAYQGNPGEGFRRNAPICKETYFSSTASTSCQASQLSTYGDASSVESLGDRRPPESLFRENLMDGDTADDKLAQAHPVVEDEESCLPTSVAKSTADYDKEKKHRWNLFWVGSLLGVFVLLIFGLLIGLIIRSQQKDSSTTTVEYVRTPTVMLSDTPTMAPTDLVVNGLSERTIQTILEVPYSAQAKAYRWLLNDPKLADYSNYRSQQRFALAVLFFSTRFTNSSNIDESIVRSWNGATNVLEYGTHECQWMEIPTDGSTMPLHCDAAGHYLWLLLSDQQLHGTLPPEISLLTSLTKIDISHNRLLGSLPSEIGLLTDLQSLQIENNTLVGSLPSELGLLDKMKQFYLFDTPTSGRLPTEVGLLSSLEELQIQRSSIAGQLPTEIGNLSLLQELFAWNTKLTGTLPTELGKMSSLTTTGMHNNGVIEGTIPSELGLLENLQRIQLDFNNLDGAIPSELAQMKSISYLSFGGNQLISTIPKELALLSETLQAFRFFQNKITGSIPSELGRMSRLNRLELDSNLLSGPIPPELGNAPFLVQLFLANNELTGSLPVELGSLMYLEDLTLNNNQELGGSIPEEWGVLAAVNLKEVFLTGVDITGTIPQAMCNIDRLQFDCDAEVCGCDCGICS